MHLGEPVAVEDRLVHSLLLINVREMFESNDVDVLICPPPFIITYEPKKQTEKRPILSRLKNGYSTMDVKKHFTYLS